MTVKNKLYGPSIFSFYDRPISSPIIVQFSPFGLYTLGFQDRSLSQTAQLKSFKPSSSDHQLTPITVHIRLDPFIATKKSMKWWNVLNTCSVLQMLIEMHQRTNLIDLIFDWDWRCLQLSLALQGLQVGPRTGTRPHGPNLTPDMVACVFSLFRSWRGRISQSQS